MMNPRHTAGAAGGTMLEYGLIVAALLVVGAAFLLRGCCALASSLDQIEELEALMERRGEEAHPEE